MPQATTGEFSVDYLDEGEGPAVVLLHSSASGNRQWRPLVASLKARHRVIAVNLFGYGMSSPWPGARALTAADQAELALAALGSVDGPVAVIGHSMGGAVAFELCIRLGARARTLVAFEPILFGHLKTQGPASAFDEIKAVARGFGSRADAGDWNAVGEWFIDYWTGAGTWAAMPEERQRNTLAMLPAVLHEWDMALTMADPGAWSAITAPVHLLYAADTRAPTREIVGLLGRTYPHWHRHALPRGGHMAPVTAPAAVNAVIASILNA